MIKSTITDFRKFIEFILRDEIVLTNATQSIGKVDLFELNNQLINKKLIDKPTFNQSSYVCIDLMYYLALDGKLVEVLRGDKDKLRFRETPFLTQYTALNDEEKYTYLLQTYWSRYAFNDLYDRYVAVGSCETLLSYIGGFSEYGMLDFEERDALIGHSEMQFFQQLQFFGLFNMTICNPNKKSGESYQAKLKRHEFGGDVARFLLSKARPLWHYYSRYELSKAMFETTPQKKDTGTETVSDIFRVFKFALGSEKVKETIDMTITNRNRSNEIAEGRIAEIASVLLKVGLKHQRGIWRELALSWESDFSVLHLGIQDAFDFDNDHMYCFYFKSGKKRPIRIGMVDDWHVDKVVTLTKISDMCTQTGQQFEYLFDFGDEWYFDIEVLSFSAEKIDSKRAVIRKCKGVSPEQYREF